MFTRENLRGAGAKVELFPGVDTWFDRINQYGDSKGVEVEHYIISSGLKEMNYTNKTQFLFRIEKGVLDVNNQGVNSQVTYILKDYDLKAFYTIICDGVDTEDADGVREILNS